MIPLTITILDKKIFWIDKDQYDNQIEMLKSRTLDGGTRAPINYRKKWVYEGTRDLEGVQLNRVKGRTISSIKKREPYPTSKRAIRWSVFLCIQHCLKTGDT